VKAITPWRLLPEAEAKEGRSALRMTRIAWPPENTLSLSFVVNSVKVAILQLSYNERSLTFLTLRLRDTLSITSFLSLIAASRLFRVG
jgi:hypothetical protein